MRADRQAPDRSGGAERPRSPNGGLDTRDNERNPSAQEQGSQPSRTADHPRKPRDRVRESLGRISEAEHPSPPTVDYREDPGVLRRKGLQLPLTSRSSLVRQAATSRELFRRRRFRAGFRRLRADTRFMATRHRLSKHFVVEEFDCKDGTRVTSRDHNGLEYLTKTFLEPLRSKFGPVHVHSGYRTVRYNRSVGGASNSFHIYTAHDGNDQASDVSCDRGSPKQWHAFLAKIRNDKRDGRGGLGLYSTFVHCDLRDYRADWRG